MISIVTPVLNGAQYIESNIESIMSLDIPYEHIIVDGGSTDNTLEIVAHYSHLILIHQTGKQGMYEAIHQGFSAAKGNIFTYVNADDRIIKKGYEKMYISINQNKIDLVYSDSFLTYEEDGKIIKSRGNRYGKFFLKRGILPFIQPSSLFTKKTYYKNNGFEFEKFRICGDLGFFYTLAKNPEIRFLYNNIPSSFFLVRKNSLGNTNSDKVVKEKIQNNIPIARNIINRFLFRVTKFL
jgi:glycosyltransferase involved in cell wall biosynthesis